ncbi:hypothetical protein HUG20_17035 [Salicibibacter cibi]|uniref:Uncharacterized protein n=1 Tax=Salicibibacter cibi TaxID=2743001 RepID=A0A7T6ZDU6_9BACI|nr:hypothetical protein [Salicibibacter cibi]QQK81447.1 hypothetical protein HUG20_17035 [Salicibibacter cibi]
MEELWSRLLSLLPTGLSLMIAGSTSLFIISAYYVNKWLNEVTASPWKNEANQRKRRKILGEIKEND